MKFSTLIRRESLMATASRHSRIFAAMMFAGGTVFIPTSVLAGTWSGATNTDWNTASNWSNTTGVAVVNSTPANIATISANITPIPTSFLIGNTSAGRVNHVAGNASAATGGDLVLGRTTGATGTWNLANMATSGGVLTGFGQGSGNLAIPDQVIVGGQVGPGTGTLNVNTSGTMSVDNELLIGASGGTGTMKMDSGTVTVANDIHIGSATGSNGTLSISGGSFTKSAGLSASEVSIGGSTTTGNLSGGTGTLNLSGGSFTSARVVNVGNRPSSTGTLNITGGTFTASSVLNVGYRSTSNGTLSISAGTLNANSDFQVGSFTGASGTVQISGGTINSGSWVVIGRKDGTEGVAAGGVGNVVMTAGTWNKTGTSNFIVGAHGNGTMTMSGGIVDVGADPAANRGITWVGEQNNCTGTLTLSNTAEFRTKSFTMGVQAGTTGTLNLNGGTAKTTKIAGGAGTSVVNFNGTQIIATGAAADFVSGLGTATIGAGGLKVNSNGFGLTIPQSMDGSGGVIKSGVGTLILSGSNSFTGASQVNAGKLALDVNSSGAGDFSIANGAALGVIQNLDFPLAVNNVTFGTTAATSLDIEIGSGLISNPTSPALAAAGTINLNGTVTVNISQVNSGVGSFPVITYGAKAGGGSFILGTLPPGVSAILTDDNAGSVTLEITNISFPKWTGEADLLNATGAWNTTSLNWIDQLSSLPTAYSNGLPVFFDDTAGGPTSITLNEAATPGGVTFNNSSLPYTIAGTGKISGATGLIKNGTADLTLNTSNEFTGAVELNGGTINLGDASSLGMGNSQVVLGGASLNFTGPAGVSNHGLALNAPATQITTANDLTFSGQVSCSNGNLVKQGPGNLKFSHAGANILGNSGTVFVHAGSLTLDGGGLQTNQVTGEMWVADQPDIPANLVLNNTSLTTSNWLAIGRGNGDNGTVNLTATGSTLTTVNFSTGFDNGLANNASEAFVNLHNTVWTNNGLTYLAESQGSTAVMNLTGNSQYNINNNLLLSRNAATCVSTLTLSDTSSITKTGGYTSIGTNGTGTLTVQNSASFTSLSGDFNISDVGTSVGFLNLKDSGVINVTNVFIGKNSGTTGTFNQTGGSFSSTSFITIGRYTASNGIINISGGSMTTTASMFVGEQGEGTLNVSGTGTVTVSGDALYLGSGPVNFGGSGTLNLNGGTVTTKQVSGGLEGNSVVNFNGGLLKAGAGANAAFMAGLDLANILSGGARIDTNGQTLTVSQMLTGTGGFTKSGTGTLTLSGANTYTGSTAVNAGTLSVTSAFFGNTSAISIASGAVLNLLHGSTDQVGSLTINGVSMAAGIYDSTTSPGVITGTGKLQVTGAASAYTTWISGFPSIPLADRDPGDDPDGDGSTNALEFALGGIPNNGSNNPKIYSIIADSSVDGDAIKEMLMTIAVRTGTPAFSGSPSPSAVQDGYTYRIDGSTTLGTFNTGVNAVNPVTAGLPTVPSGYEYRTFSLNGSNGTPGKGFLRATVISP